MSDAVVAYVPVLHEGYRRFLERHGRDKPLYVIDASLHGDYRPLAKDVRALDAAAAAAAIGAWGISSATAVLDEQRALELAEQNPSLVLPAEDISYRIVERFFPRAEVLYDTAFLRWDKTRTVQLLEPRAREADDPLAVAAEFAASGSVDWWRQVGAAIRFSTGEVRSVANVHEPHELSPYAVGDPRSNFTKGVHLELSTATHAEAALIGAAARDGIATEGAVMYVTDFPCPPCAKLIAGAGIARLYFREGYAVLDGEDVLRAAGTELLKIG
jgi:dCMP deaminase